MATGCWSRRIPQTIGVYDRPISLFPAAGLLRYAEGEAAKVEATPIFLPLILMRRALPPTASVVPGLPVPFPLPRFGMGTVATLLLICEE